MTRIALIGNPNSGKTTMFNHLTGGNQRVGNWPGVTVDKKVGKLKGYDDIQIVDLPGIYSLSPYSPEEVVSRDFLIKENPDAIINIVDGTNLERNLYLTMQVLDMGIPVVVALNMIDIVEKRGDTIDMDGLKKCLGCDVIATSALKKTGSRDVADKAVELARSGKREPKKVFSAGFEDVIEKIEGVIGTAVDAEDRRWYAVKLFERDEVIVKEMSSVWSSVEPIVSEYEQNEDDDGESIVTNERYDYIVKVVKKNVRKSDVPYVSRSEKIDKVLMNRWAALPIFILIISLVYIIAMGEFTFNEGEDNEWVLGFGSLMTGWVNDVFIGEWCMEGAAGWLEDAGVDEKLSSLIVDGIIGGVGAVIGFLPQMLVLFVALAILEDCGYMARIAFMMDRVFRRFGLSGKSFIPALVGVGCGVPGIMASRTIESESDRKITAMTVTFMPCSAKLPIIALFTGAIFGGAWYIGVMAYFIGILAMLMSGIILKKFRKFVGKPAPFIMELPEYRAPRVYTVLMSTLQRGWSFVKKAGTIILISSIIIWFLLSFDTSFEYIASEYEDFPEMIGDSLLATLAGSISAIFTPLGFGDWQSTAATFTGLVAKENVVATMGQIFGLAEVAEDGEEIWDLIAGHYTALSALAFLLFNLLCAPCFAAMGAMHRELGTWKATGGAILYQCLFAYAVALIVFQFGSIFTGDVDIMWWGIIMAVVTVLILAYLLLRKEDTDEKSLFGSIAGVFKRD